jgi:hypothetical protein
MASDTIRQCAHCGQTFILSPAQRLRLRAGLGLRKPGFCCSDDCAVAASQPAKAAKRAARKATRR